MTLLLSELKFQIQKKYFLSCDVSADLSWEVKPHQINMLYIKIRIKKHMARIYGFFF